MIRLPVEEKLEIYNAVNIVTVAVRELTCIKKLTRI